MQSNGLNGPNGRNAGNGSKADAVGYYETYDEYGRIIPPPNEPGIEIYSTNNGSGGGGGPPPRPPPPPLPPSRSVVGGGTRDNLLAEIRNGTKLRKTSQE